MGGVKEKIMSFFKANTTKNYSNATRVQNVYHGRTKPKKLKLQSEDNIIKNIRNPFRLNEMKMKQSKRVKEKVQMVIEIKPCQSKNTWIKLNHV